MSSWTRPSGSSRFASARSARSAVACSSAGYREELVTAAIERLGDLGMLDDQAFADGLGGVPRPRPPARRAGPPTWSSARRGSTAETISQAIADRRGPDEDEDGGDPSPDDVAARRLLARHAAALARVTDPRARRQRAYALLARNGFGPEIAADLAREASAEPADPADAEGSG